MLRVNLVKGKVDTTPNLIDRLAKQKMRAFLQGAPAGFDEEMIDLATTFLNALSSPSKEHVAWGQLGLRTAFPGVCVQFVGEAEREVGDRYPADYERYSAARERLHRQQRLRSIFFWARLRATTAAMLAGAAHASPHVNWASISMLWVAADAAIGFLGDTANSRTPVRRRMLLNNLRGALAVFGIVSFEKFVLDLPVNAASELGMGIAVAVAVIWYCLFQEGGK